MNAVIWNIQVTISKDDWPQWQALASGMWELRGCADVQARLASYVEDAKPAASADVLRSPPSRTTGQFDRNARTQPAHTRKPDNNRTLDVSFPQT